MPTLRMFAAAREAAGSNRAVVPGATVAEVLAAAVERFGSGFAAVVSTSRVWVNGEPAGPDTVVGEHDEIAVLPPVSGGAGSDVARPGGPLAPPSDADGRRVRMGLAWTALLFPALFGGAGWMAALLAPLAFVAATQAARSWRRLDGRPIDGAAGLVAAALVVSAVFGLTAVIVAVALVSILVVGLWRMMDAQRKAGHLKHRRSLWRTLAIGAAVGIGAAAPVALRSASAHGAVPVLALCTYALVYDASAFLVGAGAAHVWEGPAAGVASIAVVTVAVAAILVPPFRGASPWLLGIMAALLAPAGPVLASFLLGDRTSPAPVLRRLDSLLVLGPVWAVMALAMVG